MSQPLADGESTVVMNVKVPASMRDSVKRFQKEHGLKTASDAARVLLERGLVAPARARVNEAGGPCQHPIGRRIGGACALCGQPVK